MDFLAEIQLPHLLIREYRHDVAYLVVRKMERFCAFVKLDGNTHEKHLFILCIV